MWRKWNHLQKENKVRLFLISQWTMVFLNFYKYSHFEERKRCTAIIQDTATLLSCHITSSLGCTFLGNLVGSGWWLNSKMIQCYCSDVLKRKTLYQTHSRRLAGVKRWRYCRPWRPAWAHSVHTVAACFAMGPRLSFICDYVITGQVKELIATDLVSNARYVTVECHVLSGIISKNWQQS